MVATETPVRCCLLLLVLLLQLQGRRASVAPPAGRCP
jgi:hypothetical protein